MVKVNVQEELKLLDRYLISSGVTFLASFLLAFGESLIRLQDTGEAFTWAAIGGIALTALRAGIKALAEKFIIKK